MDIGLVLELDDGAHLFVLGGVNHHKRLGYVTFLHRIDLLGHLGGQILVLELRSTGVRVGHQSGVHHGVLVFGVPDDSLLKAHAVHANEFGYGVEARQGVDLVGGRYTRLEQYVPAIDSFAMFLDELDDMVAILRLDYTAYFLRIIQAERYIGKLRHELSSAYEAQLAAMLGRLGVLGVETRQHSKIRLTAGDTLGELTQTAFDTLDLLDRHGRHETQDLHLDIGRHHRYGVLRQTIVEPTDLRRRGFDVSRELLLHLLDSHLVANGLHHFLANLRTGLAEVLLHLLLRTDLRDVVVHTHIHLMAHCRFRYLHRVQFGLMQE